ncbi:MAG: hypothetical protein J6386_15265 [Candidatus Synoicihabitans palmerolidicus]|nr:hypothetical protein [Candidatus Synoicihabitans palmerolidicus]
MSALGLYLLLGLIFAALFVSFGVAKIAPPAASAGFGFKLLILPGAMVFWPGLLRRWIKQLPPPTERSAHRDAAKSHPSS